MTGFRKSDIGYIAAVLVLATAGVLYWLNGRQRDTGKAEPKRSARKAEVARPATPTPAGKDLPKPERTTPVRRDNEDAAPPAAQTAKPVRQVVELSVPPSAEPEQGRPSLAGRRPGVRVTDRDGNEVFKRRPELKTRTDRFLFGCVTKPMGSGFAVLSTYRLDEDFRAALAEKIAVLPDDDEETIAAKEEVEALKREIAGSLREGESPASVLAEIQTRYAAAARERSEARRELYRLLKEGKVDDAVAFLDRKNAEFDEAGIMRLHIPQKLAERALAR
ncbi:MAG: hypothetical protein IJR99_12250 [Kiritimatiellae bacterium]|nr:hypothetical protein [Kiritimatiellia bacterium]